MTKIPSSRYSAGHYFAVVLCWALASCSPPPERPIAYRGEYHYDREGAYLVQVGVEAKICVPSAIMGPAIDPEFSQSGGISEVVVRGMLSKPGH